MTITITIPSLPFSPIILFLGFALVADIFLALKVWRSNPKHPVNILYTLFVVMVAFWTVGWIGFWFADTSFWWSFFAKWVYISAMLIFPFFYLFTYYFPYKTEVFPIKEGVFFLMLAILLLVVFLVPDVFIASYISQERRFKPEVSLFWHIVFAAYIAMILFASFRNLWKKYKNTDGIWRRRLRQILFVMSISFAWGCLFCLVIPIVYNDVLTWIGPMIIFFMASYIWYHIFWKTNQTKPYY